MVEMRVREDDRLWRTLTEPCTGRTCDHAVVTAQPGIDEHPPAVLRLWLDDHKAKQALATAARAEMKKQASSGASFLVKKKHEKEAKQKLTTDARGRADEFRDALAAVAVDVRARAPASAGPRRLLLDVSYLVDDDAAFVAVVDEFAAGFVADGFDVSCTGPWPVYSFVGDAR